MGHLLRLTTGIAFVAVLGATAVAAPDLAVHERSIHAVRPVAQDARAVPEPLNTADARRGSELFAGTRRFANRGPACVSCHGIAGLARPGDDSFGPDLTRAHRRFVGERGLASWLDAPPTPMMHATFEVSPLTRDEVRALTAYLVQVESRGPAPDPRSRTATTVPRGPGPDPASGPQAPTALQRKDVR